MHKSKLIPADVVPDLNSAVNILLDEPELVKVLVQGMIIGVVSARGTGKSTDKETA